MLLELCLPTTSKIDIASALPRVLLHGLWDEMLYDVQCFALPFADLYCAQVLSGEECSMFHATLNCNVVL